MFKGSKYPAYKTTIKFVFIAIFEKKLRQNNKEHHLLSWLWHPYKKSNNESIHHGWLSLLQKKHV